MTHSNTDPSNSINSINSINSSNSSNSINYINYLDAKDTKSGSDFDIDKLDKPNIDSEVDAEQALRYNAGKRKWSLVDFKSLESMVEVLEYGENKYNAFNWKKGMPVTELSESLLRHMFAFLEGEDQDFESKVSHLGHILSNAMFLSYVMREKPHFDDRSRETTTN